MKRRLNGMASQVIPKMVYASTCNEHSLVYEYLLFKAHLKGDMDPPQHSCHLAHGCCQLIHFLIWEDAAVAKECDLATRTFNAKTSIPSEHRNNQSAPSLQGTKKMNCRKNIHNVHMQHQQVS